MSELEVRLVAALFRLLRPLNKDVLFTANEKCDLLYKRGTEIYGVT